ncbi:hypothetical protein JCM11491_004442 [Sporobolomyces phaffii]
MDKEGTSSLIGVGIAIVANTLISAGLNVERLAHIRRAHPRDSRRRPADERTPLVTDDDDDDGGDSRPRTDKGFLRSPLWLFGFLLINLGEVGNFVAYGFAPTSLVAPLGMTALVANVGLAPAIVGEPFRRRDLVGIAISLVGGATVVYASRSSDAKLTPNDLAVALKHPAFIAYAVTSTVLMLALACVSQTRYGDRFVLVDLSLCALAGAFTVLSTKALSSFLNLLFLETFRQPITYPVLATLLSTAFVQVNFINKSLQRFESRVVIPTQYMTFALSSVLGSAILYGDFVGMSGEKLLNFGFGCLVSAGGVYLLTRDDDDDNDDDGSGDKKEQQQQQEQSGASGPDETTTQSRGPPPPSRDHDDDDANLARSSPHAATTLIVPTRPSTTTARHPHLSLSLSPTTRILLPSHHHHHHHQGGEIPSKVAVVPAAAGLQQQQQQRPGGLAHQRSRKLSIGRFATGGYLLVGSPSGRGGGGGGPEFDRPDHHHDDNEDEDEDEAGRGRGGGGGGGGERRRRDTRRSASRDTTAEDQV